MPTLQTLPVELLALISEHLGGRELRRGKDSGTQRLTLFRNWYDAARSVFASGMDLTTVRVYSYNAKQLSRGKWSYASGQRRLMHKNTRTMRLGFVGNWHDEAESLWHIEFMNSEKGAVAAGSHEWRSRTLAPILDELFSDLGNFTALESLSVEAMKEEPRYDKYLTQVHLFSQTLRILLQSLPIVHNLTILTLDTAGTNITADAEIQSQQEPICLCSSLAAILPLIPTIRLRLPRICPLLFPQLPTITTNSPLPPKAAIKTHTLILKLHLPTFTPENATSCSDNRPITLSTTTRPANHTQDNGDAILAAARNYLTYLSHIRHGSPPATATPSPNQQQPPPEEDPTANPHARSSGMQIFRITLADPDPAGSLLMTFDVLAEQAPWVPARVAVYEDDGGMQDWEEGAV
ncbi:hypothetical protein LTR74_011839 [Friedmanniomyces endolithicus]|nr:hypothetical protein LTR74_011839 [Friedmanniomyces endolithicus]